MSEQNLERILYAMAHKPNMKQIHLTLTMKNTSDLASGLDQLKGAMQAMNAHRRKALAGTRGNKPIEWCKVEGGVTSIEVTNKGNGWHPHIHALVLCNDWIDREALSREFVRFGGGPICWASKVVPKPEHENPNAGLVAALLEVLKYPTKFDELTVKQRYEFYLTTRRKRLTDVFGCLRGIELEPLDIDSDDMSGMTGAFQDWIAKWYHRKQRYFLYKADAWGDENAWMKPDKTV